jgi:hypothetical protein
VRRTLLLALALSSRALAQDTNVTQPARTSFHAGVRVTGFTMLRSKDSYDAVYGKPMPQVGLRLEARFAKPWFAALTADYGRVSGEAQVFVPEPIGTGEHVRLTMSHVHLTAGYVFGARSPWSVYAGLGPTLLRWKEEADLESRSATDFGGHALLGLRRSLGRWEAAAEIQYTAIPNAIGEGGAAGFFGEDDLGGLTFGLAATFRF